MDNTINRSTPAEQSPTAQVVWRISALVTSLETFLARLAGKVEAMRTTDKPQAAIDEMVQLCEGLLASTAGQVEEIKRAAREARS